MLTESPPRRTRSGLKARASATMPSRRATSSEWELERKGERKVVGAEATTAANQRLRAAICESNADPTRPDGCRRLRGALLNKAGRLLLGRDRSRNSTSSSARAFAKSTGATVA